jgi:hypothetical protein
MAVDIQGGADSSRVNAALATLCTPACKVGYVSTYASGGLVRYGTVCQAR